MKSILKYISLSLMVLILTACTTVNGTSNEDETTFLSFATSGQGGTFYVGGSGMASFINENVEGVQVNAEVTQGVVENVRLLAFDQSEVGFAYGSTAYQIQNGLNEFEGHAYEGIRAVSNIHDGALNFVTLDNKNIDSIEDLAGRRVSIGPEGSGSAAVSEEFFRSVGLWDDINITNLGFDDSASSLRDGHLDAYVIGGTTPVPSLIELDATHDMKLLEVSDEYIDMFLEEHPYHIPFTIPQDGYTSLDHDINTVGYTVLWVADESVEDWVIYEMLEALYSDRGRDYLGNVQSAFSEMSPGTERYKLIDLPLHPGAESFYSDNDMK